jgi:peptidoglycan L-alanyl-D-glutamate endopeptidase CwlK
MGYGLSKRSLDRLEGLHPDLVRVVKVAIKNTTQDFMVGEGMRSIERQRQLVARGSSTTMNSRHLTGHAVDIHPYPYDGDVDGDGIPNGADWDQYWPLEKAMKQAAQELGVALVWGGDWKSFKDGPHFQLDWKAYPEDV